MPTFEFPSGRFPSPPRASVEAPDGWNESYAPGTYLAVVESVDQRRFAANVTVMMTRHTAPYDLAESIAMLRDVTAGLPEGKVDETFTRKIGGRDFVGCDLAYRHPDAGTLVQLHVFTRVDNGPVSDVVHLVGTCGADRVPHDYMTLQAILQSAEISTE